MHLAKLSILIKMEISNTCLTNNTFYVTGKLWHTLNKQHLFSYYNCHSILTDYTDLCGYTFRLIIIRCINICIIFHIIGIKLRKKVSLFHQESQVAFNTPKEDYMQMILTNKPLINREAVTKQFQLFCLTCYKIALSCLVQFFFFL
jgi:hypothetical protein